MKLWTKNYENPSIFVKVIAKKSVAPFFLGHGVVTMAVSLFVCEISSVKEWRDLQNGVRGRSRSTKMAPFDGPCTTFYWLAIVTIATSCILRERAELFFLRRDEYFLADAFVG